MARRSVFTQMLRVDLPGLEEREVMAVGRELAPTISGSPKRSCRSMRGGRPAADFAGAATRGTENRMQNKLSTALFMELSSFLLPGQMQVWRRNGRVIGGQGIVHLRVPGRQAGSCGLAAFVCSINGQHRIPVNRRSRECKLRNDTGRSIEPNFVTGYPCRSRILSLVVAL